MEFKELQEKIVKWSTERKIIENSSAETQLFKAFSEMGELADATIKNDVKEQIDAVGDVLVCLINYCEIKGLDMLSCLNSAYNEIKDRKGVLLENGCFIKDEKQKEESIEIRLKRSAGI